MMPDDVELAAERFRLALELFEAGEALKRQQLRREHPGASESQIEALLVAWLRDRPGAPHGDAEGRPVPWPRPVR